MALFLPSVLPPRITPVIVAGKDEGELDNDYFLVPVAVKDHEGPLENKFPVEHRLLPQGGWVGGWLAGWLAGRTRLGCVNHAHAAPACVTGPTRRYRAEHRGAAAADAACTAGKGGRAGSLVQSQV